jgi:parallel beta-helix repeat protein
VSWRRVARRADLRRGRAWLWPFFAATVFGVSLPSAAQAATFTPVADSYVDSSNPTGNYGARTSLRTDASPTVTSYVRFDVQGVPPGASAKLRVHANSANTVGFQLRSVSSNSWSETGINHNNAPALGPVIRASGKVTANTWYEFDVSPQVTGNGPVSFALTSTSATATSYSSREGANPPQLIAPASPPSPPASRFDVTRSGTTTYTAQSPSGGGYTGTLKQVVESAVAALASGEGGTINFGAGDFDLGTTWWEFHNLRGITFQGQGMDATTIRNSTSATTDTEPFDVSTANDVVIRDLTVDAGGGFRSTSDAIDFDGGNNILIERVKVTGARGRGIVFDGKDIVGGVLRSAERNTIRNCVVTGVPTDGIELLAAWRNRIEGCTVTDVGGHGIQLTKSSASAAQPNKPSTDNTLASNLVRNSGQDGINLNAASRNQLLGNTVLNSSDDVSSKDGIRIGTADLRPCDDNVVSNNTSSDNQAVHTQRYGLHISSALCNRTVVSGNTFSGNLLAPIRDVGTNTQYP